MKMSPRSETCKLGKPFAIGGTAEIYDWEPGWALKLYFNRFQRWMADYERGKVAAICATGVPVQAVGEGDRSWTPTDRRSSPLEVS